LPVTNLSGLRADTRVSSSPYISLGTVRNDSGCVDDMKSYPQREMHDAAHVSQQTSHRPLETVSVDDINLISSDLLALVTPAPIENLNLAAAGKGELDGTFVGEDGEYILCLFLPSQHLGKRRMVLLFELIVALFLANH
jgi:hypothetical protein